MKRICIILALVLVLTCFFGCTQSMGGDESSSQPLSSEASTQTLPMEKRIFTVGAKVGIYSESGEVLPEDAMVRIVRMEGVKLFVEKL